MRSPCITHHRRDNAYFLAILLSVAGLVTACNNGVISRTKLLSHTKINKAVKLSDIVNIPFTSVHVTDGYCTVQCGCPDSKRVNAFLNSIPCGDEGDYRLIIATKNGIHISTINRFKHESWLFTNEARLALNTSPLSLSIEPSNCISEKQAVVVRINRNGKDCVFLAKQKDSTTLGENSKTN